MKKRKMRNIFLLIILIFILFKTFQRTSNTIVIDPGHGGHDPGTIGINNCFEKDINLQISKKLSKKLKFKGHKVILTRNTDEYIDNNERANLANRKRAKIFISVHCNAMEDNSDTNGVQVLYYPNGEINIKDSDNQLLAQIILDNVLGNTGAVNKGIVERKDLIVLNQTKMPAIIVEAGFLSNLNEANLLATDEYQNKIVDGIVNGLGNYIND